ncbi:alternate-type signal peptide domain-containing protein [Nesterenkonia sp. CF4.4]|uniref:alternate-type signal peptide domain-containing protein n=1 Tax=Nesterenkonia sp. CF4.4 TaxID=3373079 RepID=UPI003EE54B53
MEKITRASIAGVAGLGLLAGGATFALWSDSEPVPDAEISSGTLTLSPASNIEWTDLSGTEPAVITDITAYEAIPGARLQYAADFAVNASGDNLTAVLDTTGMANASVGELSGDAVSVVSEFTLNGAPVTTVSSSDESQTVSVTVDIEVSDLGDTVGQNGQIVLSNGQVTLTQESLGQ